MIQRKQSIWLFLAAILNAGVFLFDLYRANVTASGAVTTQQVLRVSDHFPSLIIALVITLLPLVTIFMFKNRKRQIAMTAAAIVSTISFITMTLMRVGNLEKETPGATGSYWVGAVLPVVALVFMVMAIAGVRKDEKLVRSMDRLR